MTKEYIEQLKSALQKCEKENENRETYTCEVIVSKVCKDAKNCIAELEQQIEKMKRHCNCKHRDSAGYCEVKRTYLVDLSYDGCDKWELED